MPKTIYATFNDASLAEKAVGALLDHGVRNEDISVISRESGVYSDSFTIVDAHGGSYVELDPVSESPLLRESHTERAGKQGLSTTTSGDARVGAEKGASIGLGLGVAAALTSLIVPGIGLVLGGGALATALAGAAGATAAGAITGGLTGYLVDQGAPDFAAVDYQHAYENGSAVLLVHAPSGNVRQDEIEGLLSKYQATNLRIYEALAP